tara:strand:+ start:50 stop:199 length:150 start_codon:yes stop_codon:yes gene_type:complete
MNDGGFLFSISLLARQEFAGMSKFLQTQIVMEESGVKLVAPGNRNLPSR